MQFSGIQEFLAMGGYGLYVWLAWGFCFIAVGGLILASVLRRRRLLGEVRRAEARQQRIAAARLRQSQSVSNQSGAAASPASEPEESAKEVV